MDFIDKPSLDDIMHYGIKRRSGRYPYGSGENPYQHCGDFLGRVKELEAEGLSEPEIASMLGIVNKDGKPSTTKLRTQLSLAKFERRSLEVETAKGLREKGLSLNQIAEKMGYANDSSVRSLLNEKTEERMNEAMKTAEFIKSKVDEKGMIDVGKGVEIELGISREKLKQALYILELEGYPTYGGGVPQATNPGKQTNIQVICPPGTKHKNIYDYENVHSLREYTSHDDGKSFTTFQYPKSMDSKRLQICYAEDGGTEKDGVIELRRGVKDLSLGDAHYAQVRILVDDKKYLKGMAIYSDDLPPGVDVRFNTNKTKDVPKLEVLKNIKNDPDNPFGSYIKPNGQSTYVDEKGNEQLSLINKRAEEGDWSDWGNKLPSQFLAKQNTNLIRKQLKLTAVDKQDEFEEIRSLNNPTIKKRLLQSFADDCDSAAVHLKAAALPRQGYHVILPINSLKDSEVYAPNYRDGEKVALIRYPHGGTFEIPILTVNNKHPESKKVLGNTIDGVGINSNVAGRLSGADFDGDTVMVIPTNNKVKITSSKSLEGLAGFDPKMEYPERKGMRYMSKDNTQKQMGVISNLITDMTLKGATEDELARAVRHSMVVIDAEKHKLNYRQSELDNGIESLKRKYQGHIENGSYHEGASTLLSRAKSEVRVPKRKGSPKIDPDTGEVYYKEVHEEYIDKKTGKLTERTDKSTKMGEAKDAHSLSTGTTQEEIYAEYANKMKTLANEARKEMLITGSIPYSKSAKDTYMNEVKSLDAKLKVSLANSPKERLAQVKANAEIKAKKQDNPDIDKDDLKKIKNQALARARVAVGAERVPVKITDKEWEAIQAGAISESKLRQIIDHTDIDALKQRAMPRATSTLRPTQISKIASMNASGYTMAQIAEALGVSTSTVSKYLRGKGSE